MLGVFAIYLNELFFWVGLLFRECSILRAKLFVTYLEMKLFNLF